METLKQWITLTVVAAVALVAAGWFLVISPKRSEAAEVRTQVASQLSSNDVLATQIEVLKAKSRDLPAEQARLARVAALIPENPALPDLVRRLLDASAATGVELISITPGQPVLATAAAPAAPTGSAPAPAAPAPAAAPAAPAASAAGQLATIPVAINVVGGYFEVTQFMTQLEQLPRALRVNNLTMAPGTAPSSGQISASELASGNSLTTTINGTVYMRAGGAAAGPAAAAPSAPVDAAPAAAAPKN